MSTTAGSERWPATVSVGVIIETRHPLPHPDTGYYRPAVLLVRDGLGRWGLPAGGIEEGESLIDAGHREVRQETGLDRLSYRNLAHFRTIAVPKELKTSLGVVYQTELFVDVPQEGLLVIDPGGDIEMVRPHTIDEVREIIDGDNLRVPYFNKPVLEEWLRYHDLSDIYPFS